MSLSGALASRQGAEAVRQDTESVREPALAGQFYPAEAKALAAAVDAYVKDAVKPSGQRPFALVAPHASLIFSGQIAADAWNQAAGHAYDTIVLLGTNHTGANARRVSIYPGAGLRTPLGVVAVDADVVRALLDSCKDCVADATAHAKEHSVEVQLPFLQRLFPQARVVAAIVGPEDAALGERFGRALAGVLQGRQALVVASSDLSHYPRASDAPAADRRTLEAIAALDAGRLADVVRETEARGIRDLVTCACGLAPVTAAMTAATILGATRGHILSYTHSGDTAVGGPEKVVGYGAVAFTGGERGVEASGLPGPNGDAPLAEADRAGLLRLARETIRRALESGTVPLARGLGPGVDRHQGVFVTLKKRGRLRGCVGQVQPTGPIKRVVGTMALAAAFQDQRFDKVKASELGEIEVEISLLTPLKPVAGVNAILPGRDGVALQKAGKSSVFLPEIAAEEGWTREELLENLCLKAGLPEGCWIAGAKLFTFRAEKFSEQAARR